MQQRLWGHQRFSVLLQLLCGITCTGRVWSTEHELGWHHSHLFPRICELFCCGTQPSVSSALRIKMLCKASCTIKSKKPHCVSWHFRVSLACWVGTVFMDRAADANKAGLPLIRGKVWCLKLQYWEGVEVLHFLFYLWDYF